MGLIARLEALQDTLQAPVTLGGLLAADAKLQALLTQLPGIPVVGVLEPAVAAEVLSAVLVQIAARTQLGQRLLPPLSLQAMGAPAELLRSRRGAAVQIRVRADLPAGLYARSLPYRGRIEISPPSSLFLDPRYHLEALCRGGLALELRALQHELVHLQQVQAGRELLWIGVMALVPLLWPVLVYFFFARMYPPTARHVLAAQELQAHLQELEHGEQPERAAQHAVVALGAYPFARYLEPGELEGITALLQALEVLGVEGAALSAVIRRMPPHRGISLLAAEVQRRCVACGWGEEALRRAVLLRALRLRVDRALVSALARQAVLQCAR